MRVLGPIAIVLAVSGCIGSGPGGFCYETARMGHWTQPGLWALVEPRAGTGGWERYSAWPGEYGPELDPALTSRWWNGTAHFSGVTNQWDTLASFSLHFRPDMRRQFDALLPDEWEADKIQVKAEEFLRDAGATDSQQRQALAAALLAGKSEGPKGHPYFSYRTTLPDGFRLAPRILELGLEPELGAAGSLVLRAGNWSSSIWSMSVQLPAVRHSMPYPVPDILVDAGDRVSGGYAKAADLHEDNPALAQAQDAWWQANATADFAALGLPAPTFQDATHEVERTCVD